MQEEDTAVSLWQTALCWSVSSCPNETTQSLLEVLQSTVALYLTPVVEYSDEHVCVSVCVHFIRIHVSERHQMLCACCLWQNCSAIVYRYFQFCG